MSPWFVATGLGVGFIVVLVCETLGALPLVLPPEPLVLPPDLVAPHSSVDDSRDAALERLRRVEESHRAQGLSPFDSLVEQAQLLLDLGRATEADETLTRAESCIPKTEYGSQLIAARLWWLRARVQTHYARYRGHHAKTALRLLDDAARAAGSDSALLAEVSLTRVQLDLDGLRVEREPREGVALERALAASQMALEHAKKTADAQLLASTRMTRAEVVLLRGWKQEAVDHATPMATQRDADLRWRAHHVLGRVAELNGEDPRPHYARSLEALESIRRDLRHEDGDGSFVASRARIYQDAALAAHAAGSAREALWIVECARARFDNAVPDRAAFDDLPGRLSPEQSFVVPFDTGRGLLVGQIRPEGFGAELVEVSTTALRRSIATLQASHGSDGPASEDLNRWILGPLRATLTPRLYLVPYGVLRGVPFDALFDGRDYVMEHHTVSVLPALRVSRDRSSLRPGSVLALLDPNTDYDRDGKSDRPGLPHAEDGVTVLAQRLSGSAVLRGSEATEAAASRELPHRIVVHFACHGIFEDLRPWNSALLLSPGENQDGRLSARELRGFTLKDTELVCLSGCETGLLEVQGADGLAGFPGAALRAGARRFLGSLWKVEDGAAGRFMARFYGHLAEGTPVATALRQTRLDTLRHETDSSAAHWGPWILLESEILPEKGILNDEREGNGIPR